MPTRKLHQTKPTQAVGGDAATRFDSLFRAYAQKVHYYALKLTKSRIVAEDITQEVFVRLWEKRDAIDPYRNPESYIIITARHLCLNYLKRAAHNKKIQDELYEAMKKSDWAVDEHLASKELESLYANAIRLLPPQKRKIFSLSRINGLNHIQIASILQLSGNTVKNHITVASRMIREQVSRAGLLFLLSEFIF